MLRLVIALLALLTVLGAGCGGAQQGAPGARTTVLSFQGLDCSDCGTDMARDLVKEEGVLKTAFDKRKAELTVTASPDLDVFALAQRLKPKGEAWDLLLGPGKGSYIAWKTPPEGADVKELARDGEDVPDLAPHLAAGKVNIVDFSAKWCEPCRALDAHITQILGRRKDVAYRKLDVGDWDTPLGKRYLTGVKELPYVIVFDGQGKKVDEVSGIDLARLDGAIEKAAGGKPAP